MHVCHHHRLDHHHIKASSYLFESSLCFQKKKNLAFWVLSLHFALFEPLFYITPESIMSFLTTFKVFNGLHPLVSTCITFALHTRAAFDHLDTCPNHLTISLCILWFSSIGATGKFPLMYLLLILFFLKTPHINFSIYVSATCTFASCFFVAQHPAP